MNWEYLFRKKSFTSECVFLIRSNIHVRTKYSGDFWKINSTADIAALQPFKDKLVHQRSGHLDPLGFISCVKGFYIYYLLIRKSLKVNFCHLFNSIYSQSVHLSILIPIIIVATLLYYGGWRLFIAITWTKITHNSGFLKNLLSVNSVFCHILRYSSKSRSGPYFSLHFNFLHVP